MRWRAIKAGGFNAAGDVLPLGTWDTGRFTRIPTVVCRRPEDPREIAAHLRAAGLREGA